MVGGLDGRARPARALAQHFLVSGPVLRRITAAARLNPEEVVLEVGPGRGALTRWLVPRVARVIAVERDPYLAATLARRLGQPPNLTSVTADARWVDLATLVGQETPYKVVANLPYYAANPIVRRFLESVPPPQLMVVMLQEEVARSMVAAPGQMTFLSVATQLYATASLVCTVPPSAFRPPPKVTSAVVRLEPRPLPGVSLADAAPFLALVRAGFSAPRKQLVNSLSHGLSAPSAQTGRLLASVGLDGTRRAETLSLEEWALLYRAWEGRSGEWKSGPSPR